MGRVLFWLYVFGCLFFIFEWLWLRNCSLFTFFKCEWGVLKFESICFILFTFFYFLLKVVKFFRFFYWSILILWELNREVFLVFIGRRRERDVEKILKLVFFIFIVVGFILFKINRKNEVMNCLCNIFYFRYIIFFYLWKDKFLMIFLNYISIEDIRIFYFIGL